MIRRVAAAALLACAGCAASPPARWIGEGLPADKVAELVRREQVAVRTVEAQARVRTETPERGGSYDAEVWIARPQRFRMFAILHGTTLYDLLLDAQALTVYAPADNVVIRRRLGEAGDARGLTGVEKLFARTGLADLLLGPDRFAPEERWLLLDRTPQALHFGVFVGSRQRGEVVVAEGALLPISHRLLPDGAGTVGLTVRYAEWREVETPQGPLFWPHTIEVECPDERFYMAFRFDTVKLNSDPPADAFLQDIPADAKPPAPAAPAASGAKE